MCPIKEREQKASLLSLLEETASIREGSPRGANVRLIRRLLAGVLELRERMSGVISTPYKIGGGEA